MIETNKKDHNGNTLKVGDKVFVNYKCKFNSDSFFGFIKVDEDGDFYIEEYNGIRSLDLEIPSHWIFIVNCTR